jgi:hypothetical protein
MVSPAGLALSIFPACGPLTRFHTIGGKLLLLWDTFDRLLL